MTRRDPHIVRALQSAGEVGRDLLAADWSLTPLGAPEQWPPSLSMFVRVMLGSRFSMWMAWGPELTFFCNDAYRRDTLGKKYPWALGRPAREVWAEIWPDIGPRIETVLQTGEATWDESLMLFLERSGYVEETYHTFSYSPLIDDAGRDRGHAVRGQRGHRARGRRAADGDPARSRVRTGDGTRRVRLPPRRRPPSRRQPLVAAVHAHLPVRRRRAHAPSWPPPARSPPGMPPLRCSLELRAGERGLAGGGARRRPRGRRRRPRAPL